MEKRGPDLSLLIPIYNEEPNLPGVLDQLLSVKWPGPTEFVLVDDCSKDKSLEVLKTWVDDNRELLQKNQIECVIDKLDVNSGKGGAIHKAIELATGKVLIVQDADFEYDPNEVPSLVAPILANRADVVYGSRFKKTSRQVHRTFHYLANRVLTALSNLFSGIYLTDMETCYKAFRSDILKNINLKSKRFGFEPEITAHLSRLQTRLLESEISYFPRNYLEGKKISWKDGIAALWHIMYFNIFMNDKERFKPGMPQRFIPKGRQWL